MGLLAALALGAHAARIPGNLEMIATYNAGDRYAGYASAWRNFFEAARWIEENTPPDAVVTVRKPRLFNAVGDTKGDGNYTSPLGTTAGTAETWYDPDLEFHFLRINTLVQSRFPDTNHRAPDIGLIEDYNRGTYEVSSGVT